MPNEQSCSSWTKQLISPSDLKCVPFHVMRALSMTYVKYKIL